jgi:hypothetical protein
VPGAGGRHKSIRCAIGNATWSSGHRRLKQHRAIATRYDKLAVSYHTWLVLAALLLWLPDERVRQALVASIGADAWMQGTAPYK